MGKKNIRNVVRIFLVPAVVFAVLLCFMVSLSNLNNGQDEKGREQLEKALRRAAVACYAAEGIYPPDVAYLQEHYGVQVNEEQYVVHYNVFAENLMPDITVVEKES